MTRTRYTNTCHRSKKRKVTHNTTKVSKIILLKNEQIGTLKQSQEKNHSYKTKHTQNVIKTNIAN